MPTPFPAYLWLTAAKQILDAARQTVRWLDAWQPPSEAESGEFSIQIYPEPKKSARPEQEPGK